MCPRRPPGRSSPHRCAGVIKRAHLRDPRGEGRRAIIRRSSSSMTPALSASPTSILISSSVTVLSFSGLPPKSWKISRVDVFEQPDGRRARPCEISSISGATAQATLSGLRSAKCLGTSSPMTMEKNVMRPITMPKPRARAARGGDPVPPGRSASAGTPGPRPKKAPARMPTRVMPIWTVERKPARNPRMSVRAVARRRSGPVRPWLQAGTAGGNDGEFG